MARIKNPIADLRAKYQRFFEISLIASLALLIVAFKFFPHLKPQKEIAQVSQDLFKVEDVQQTRQENRPPPPPKPAIPIAAPSEDVLQDVNIGSTELDVNANVGAPPPPPEKKAKSEEPTYFVAVEQMPTPVGGIAGIQSKIVYPEIAKRAGVEGRVFILAFVDKEGDVTKAKVVKGIGAGCDEAALKAVEATKFNPGKQRGKPVNVQVTVPVYFRLNN
jgi:periplasmic protein TonB